MADWKAKDSIVILGYVFFSRPHIPEALRLTNKQCRHHRPRCRPRPRAEGPRAADHHRCRASSGRHGPGLHFAMVSQLSRSSFPPRPSSNKPGPAATTRPSLATTTTPCAGTVSATATCCGSPPSARPSPMWRARPRPRSGTTSCRATRSRLCLNI